jgi:hypothetical protein
MLTLTCTDLLGLKKSDTGRSGRPGANLMRILFTVKNAESDTTRKLNVFYALI